MVGSSFPASILAVWLDNALEKKRAVAVSQLSWRPESNVRILCSFLWMAVFVLSRAIPSKNLAEASVQSHLQPLPNQCLKIYGRVNKINSLWDSTWILQRGKNKFGFAWCWGAYPIPSQGLSLHSEGSAGKSKMWWFSVGLNGTFPVKGIWFLRALFVRGRILH